MSIESGRLVPFLGETNESKRKEVDAVRLAKQPAM